MFATPAPPALESPALESPDETSLVAACVERSSLDELGSTEDVVDGAVVGLDVEGAPVGVGPEGCVVGVVVGADGLGVVVLVDEDVDVVVAPVFIPLSESVGLPQAAIVALKVRVST